eukprot:gene740-1419_t
MGTSLLIFISFALMNCILNSSVGSMSSPIQQTNLLFIMFDDLRPDLSVYGRNYMVTPNFERLAKMSVVFDNSYCQVSVCNPSRDSMLTGLRPDTTGTYSFQWTFRPLMIFPTQLTRSGYTTRGIGKILHWETDPNVWNDQFQDNWYDYQNTERDFMNSTTMPDKTRPEESFKDHLFTTKAINTLRELHNKDKYFLIGLGLKLPHLSMHIPYEYYKMYLDKQEYWKLSEQERTFPSSTPGPAYRCCADNSFRYMNEEGAKPSIKDINIGDKMDYVIPDDMRNELMLGYCGAITFLDKQIGRILDVVDELSLWSNLTIVLTSDHGIHNGEKGLWEKWTMFDESTRVPLMIHHPQSPFKGRHYSEPVELLDIYPTLNDLLGAPYDEKVVCKETSPSGIHKCLPLQGKSLAKVILGDVWQPAKGSQMTIDRPRGKGGRGGGGRGGKGGKGKGKGKGSRNRGNREKKDISGGGGGGSNTESQLRRLQDINQSNFSVSKSMRMPVLDMDFAITQSWRCASKEDVQSKDKQPFKPIWKDCSRDDNNNEKGAKEICVMGYSMRTIDFRYTAWLYFNRTSMSTIFDNQPFEEELYDHRKEKPDDFTHLELINLANSMGYREIAFSLKEKLVSFLKANIVFQGPYTEKPN